MLSAPELRGERGKNNEPQRRRDAEKSITEKVAEVAPENCGLEA